MQSDQPSVVNQSPSPGQARSVLDRYKGTSPQNLRLLFYPQWPENQSREWTSANVFLTSASAVLSSVAVPSEPQAIHTEALERKSLIISFQTGHSPKDLLF